MTADQFEALAKLIQLKQGPSRLAAKLVLVHGLRGIDAAQQAGITPQAASNVLRRCRSGIALAKIASQDITTENCTKDITTKIVVLP